MFEVFRKTVATTIDAGHEPRPWSFGSSSEVLGFDEFMRECGGATFSGGLYRVHDRESAEASGRLVRESFPEFAATSLVFGYDWLGRQFALDFRRGEAGQPWVLMFEPGTGEALEIDACFADFHDEEMVEYADAVLAIDAFDRWQALHPGAPPLGRDQCVGYEVPLFLGGRDELDNFAVSDLDVYWTLCGQLRRGVTGQG